MVDHVLTCICTVPETPTSHLGTLPARELPFNCTFDLDPGEELFIPRLDGAYQSLVRTAFQASLNQIRTWVAQKNNESGAAHAAAHANFSNFLATGNWQGGADGAIVPGGTNLWGGLGEYDAYLETWKAQLAARIENDVATQMMNVFNSAIRSSFANDALRKQNKQTLHRMPEHQQFRRKRARVWVGKGTKAVMLGTITAVQAASAGAGHPAPGILTAVKAIGAVWRNLPRIITLSQACWEDTKIQLRTLKKAEKDIKAVLAAFDEAKTRGSSLAKHVTEMHGQMTMRRQKLEGLRREITEANKIRTMPNAQVSRELLDKAIKRIAEIERKITTLEEYDTKMQQLTDQMAAFNIVLPQAAYNAQANTVLGNLKKFFMSAAGQGELGTLFHDVEASAFDIENSLQQK